MKSKSITTIVVLSLVLISLCLCTSIAQAAVIYFVKPGGNDANAGTSWALAKRTVQGAINVAGAGDEIWVAAGTYNEHIINRNIGGVAVDVALYGGFAGNETLRSQRDPQANITILNGTNNGVVVTIKYAAGRATRIDGFIITGGNASAAPGDPGGGIHVTASAPTIANNTIKGNLSYGVGAGVSIWYFRPLPGGAAEYPLVINNRIENNFAYDSAGDGGGIGIVGSSPEIRNNVIVRNQANQNGGGICMWENSAPVIANNYITANTSNILDGGSTMNYGGGGIFASSFYEDGTPCQECESSPEIFNNVIAANGALKGGGIAVTDTNGGVAVITNNTVAANNGAGINWANAASEIRNNLVAYNTWGMEQWTVGTSSVALGYNNVFGNSLQGGSTDYEGIADATGSNGNISADPKLANYPIGDFHIQPDSPCVNAGTSAAVGVDWTDMDGQARIVGSSVDIGADESDGTVWNVATPVIRVKTDGNDANDGSSWANAKRTLAAGIQAATSTGGEVWVKAGTYVQRITVPAFVYLYGGFAGTETERSARNIAANPTVIDGSNTPPVVSFTQAGYLVSTLDGFTVQHGGVYVGEPSPTNLPNPANRTGGRGGGLYIRTSGPLVENNTIRWNSLGSPYTTLTPFPEGAGIGCFIAHPLIAGNSILENENLAATGTGGGIYCKSSRPWINRNLIRGNRAVYGAAIYCGESEPRISGNTIEKNTMYEYYPLYQYANFGAVSLYICRDFLIDGNRIADNKAFEGAGICVMPCFNGRIVNNLIVNNKADQPNTTGGIGGGIYCEVAQTPLGDQLNDVLILNNTIVGNTATSFFVIGGGGGIAIALLEERLIIANNIVAYNSSGIWQAQSITLDPEFIHNDFFDNPAGPGTDYNYVYLTPGPTDIALNPQFVDWDGPDNNPATTADNDYHLAPGSPCIDAGDGAVPGVPTVDIEGNTRPKDGNSDGTAEVDIGAYEFGLALPIIDQIDYDGCISELCTSVITVTADDPAGGNLTYTWAALNGGTIIGSGAAVTFDPPGPSVAPACAPYQVKVTITSDASGLSTSETIDIYVKLAGDADGNGRVDVLDRLLVRNHFGETPASPGWDPRADVNYDGRVDVLDRLTVRNQFGQTGCACQ